MGTSDIDDGMINKSFVLADVKIKASHDFGIYKMGEYNKRLVIGCAIEDNSINFSHSWKWSVYALLYVYTFFYTLRFIFLLFLGITMIKK